VLSWVRTGLFEQQLYFLSSTGEQNPDRGTIGKERGEVIVMLV
jgi:hypothetical protein